MRPNGLVSPAGTGAGGGGFGKERFCFFMTVGFVFPAACIALRGRCSQMEITVMYGIEGGVK